MAVVGRVERAAEVVGSVTAVGFGETHRSVGRSRRNRIREGMCCLQQKTLRLAHHRHRSHRQSAGKCWCM